MNDSLAKLLEYIEPKIVNIQENRIEFQSLNKVYQTMEEIVSLGKSSYLDILDYYDQEFIIKTLKISKEKMFSNVEKYESSRYLLMNKNSNIKELPQYKNAINYMESLVEYLFKFHQEIKEEFELKKIDLEEQELLNKYYIILNRNNIIINDIEEFFKFLNSCKIDINEKLNILVYINKCNLKNYMTNKNISLSSISSLLTEYKDLLNSEFHDDKDMEMDTLILLKNNDISILNKKKSYLINKIEKLYKAKLFDEIFEYLKEFEKVLQLEQEVLLQKTRFSNDFFKKLVFASDDNKSLVRKFLEECDIKYKSCIYKNLLDIEKEDEILLPDYLYNEKYLYIKNEFVVKTVYTYLENGYVLVLGVLNKSEKIDEFIDKNKVVIDNILNNLDNLIFDLKERDLILKNIKIEDLVLTIDLNTLDIKMEDENAR